MLVGIVVTIASALLTFRSTLSYVRTRSLASGLKAAGAACLIIVGLAHVFEALRLFPSMGWGLKHSAGHYLDLVACILGLTLYPIGFLSGRR